MSKPISSHRKQEIGPGSLVGRYRIESLLGSGGMAEVYYAVHEDLHRPAAIKVLRSELASDATSLQRFTNEARSAASLIHPNIVQVYDVGRDGDVHYIAQEYIPGTNLRQYLSSTSLPDDDHAADDGPVDSPEQSAGAAVETRKSSSDGRDPTTGDRQLALNESLSILLQVLAALNKSAVSGIVHRDIKPENIMLNEDGDVKVADFGLARMLLGDDPKLTRAGTTLGTPMYMSPEQIQDGVVDVRSDLYSLGVTLYHMLAGRPPFVGDTQLALAMKHAQADVPDILQFRPDTPEALVKLLDRLLQKAPENRFATPAEVLGYLQERRSADLAEDWPEHTVPLPQAGAVDQPRAMEATLKLQSLINKRERGTPSGWRWWQ